MPKNHRTALLIDASKGFANPFAERVNRLLQSVNGPNIKVDVYHLGVGGNVTLQEGAPTSTPAYGSATTVEAAEAQLRAQGYDQILVSKPGK